MMLFKLFEINWNHMKSEAMRHTYFLGLHSICNIRNEILVLKLASQMIWLLSSQLKIQWLWLPSYSHKVYVLRKNFVWKTFPAARKKCKLKWKNCFSASMGEKNVSNRKFFNFLNPDCSLGDVNLYDEIRPNPIHNSNSLKLMLAKNFSINVNSTTKITLRKHLKKKTKKKVDHKLEWNIGIAFNEWGIECFDRNRISIDCGNWNTFHWKSYSQVSNNCMRTK